MKPRKRSLIGAIGVTVCILCLSVLLFSTFSGVKLAAHVKQGLEFGALVGGIAGLVGAVINKSNASSRK